MSGIGVDQQVCILILLTLATGLGVGIWIGYLHGKEDGFIEGRLAEIRADKERS